MRHTSASRRLVPLMIAGVILTACGGDGNEAADNNTDTLAVVTPTTASTNTPSPTSKATAQALATTMVQRDDQPANAESAEQTTDSQVTLTARAPDDPWGKERPEGPIPTAPPAPPSDFDTDGDGMYTLDEFEVAIRYRYPEYEWPPNYQLDLDKALDGMEFPEGSRIEAPGEYTFLGLYHACAWELTLIDASLENDQSLIDESIYQLVEFGQNTNPLSHDENGKAFMRDMYERAALGDVAPLQQWVDNNCERMRPYFITSNSSTPPSARQAEDEDVFAVFAPTS